MQVLVPVSHCKDTIIFDKTSNFFKKLKKTRWICSARSLKSVSYGLIGIYGRIAKTSLMLLSSIVYSIEGVYNCVLIL